MINREALQKIAENNLEYKINSAIKEEGFDTNQINLMFKFISKFFVRIPPELLRYEVRIIILLNQIVDKNWKVISIDEIYDYINKPIAVIILDEFRCVISDYKYNCNCDIFEYQYYSPMNEVFFINGKKIDINQYADTASCSVFTIPTYKELDEALDEYYNKMAKSSVCNVLKNVWKDETNMEFCIKPEQYMQKSLWQFLHVSLRSHSVLREQTVDASHPVDIKIMWPILKVIALIEIKWLGDSGKVQYRDKRANDGALQLIQYIDASYRGEPDKHFKGYLVVYDGRRKKGQKDYYKFKEIKYKQEYLRDLRMSYKRFYLETECSIP
jgi:hypothetical protein